MTTTTAKIFEKKVDHGAFVVLTPCTEVVADGIPAREEGAEIPITQQTRRIHCLEGPESNAFVHWLKEDWKWIRQLQCIDAAH